jgi:signal transduction histidine kinase/DNA-binding response OmpR family regulator
MRVLVIDDNQDNLAAVSALVRALMPGCETQTAQSGREGLDRASTFQPDTILLDVQMPGMDGFQVCRKLKDAPDTCHIPVIFLTAYNTDPASRARGLEIGADAFLAKPVEPVELVAQIRAMVRIKQAEDALRGDKRSLEEAVEERTAALAFSAAKWSETFDAISDVVCVISKDFDVLEINLAGCAFVGRAKSQMAGKKCYELFHGTTAPVAECPCARSAVTGRPASGVLEQAGRYHELFAWPIASDGGAARAYVHIVKDATAQMAEKREKEQLEDRLRQSHKMEAIGRLAGGVAHDFNNLLSVILNHAEFVLEGVKESDPVCDDVLEIRKAGERAASLTRQLLAFSRKQVIQPQTLNLNSVIRETEGMLRRLIGEDVELSTTLAHDLGLVRADKGQLSQVVMNLVVNSRDAMPNGGRIVMETSNCDIGAAQVGRDAALEAGPHVMLSVTDTGMGMDEATRARLFEPFFTTKELGRGTGLGLATVYGIVKQSGGDIQVVSELGKGTTFQVLLPRKQGSVTRELHRGASVTRAVAGETVVVVEDEPAVRNSTRRILIAAGYGVLEAANGAAALALCESHDGGIDLLLTDVVMPGIGGRELAARLKQLRPRVKVLYMSGYTDTAAARGGEFDEDARFIGKPFTAAELTRSIREALDESATPAPTSVRA